MLSSFLRFVSGFLFLISLSFGITYAVNAYAAKQAADNQTAAALQAMLQLKQ